MQKHVFVAIVVLCVVSTYVSAKVLKPVSLHPLATSRRSDQNVKFALAELPGFDSRLVASQPQDLPPDESRKVMISKIVHLSVLFILWYAFNAGYNISNAYMKRDFPFPWAAATLQLVVGTVFRALPMWLSRNKPLPALQRSDFKRLLPIAAMNAVGHASAVVSMFQTGGGSFTHVIKASEPVVSAVLGLLINKQVPRPLTALSLLPVTYGVAYASTLGRLNWMTFYKEMSTTAAEMAMVSNVALSMRSILRKNLPKDFQQRTNLDPVNEFATTTVLSILLLLPFVFMRESVSDMSAVVLSLLQRGLFPSFIMNLAVCGGCFYLYNELQNIVLGSLGAVPTAVGSTLRRVVIFVALYLFTPGEVFPWPKVLGCAIAIAGCLAFAIFDSLKL